MDPSGLYGYTPQSPGSNIGLFPSMTGCMLDGFDIGCGQVEALQFDSAAVQCPDDRCEAFTADGQFAQFVAGAGGAQGYLTSSAMAQGLNEWDGSFYTDSQFEQFIEQGSEAYHEQLANFIFLNSTNQNVSWSDIYQSLVYQRTSGSNSDFSWNSSAVGVDFDSLGLDIPLGRDGAGCEWSCRLGDSPSLHYKDSGQNQGQTELAPFFSPDVNAEWSVFPGFAPNY